MMHLLGCRYRNQISPLLQNSLNCGIYMIDFNVPITSLFTRKNHHQIMRGATMLANIPWVVSDIEEDDENEKKKFSFSMV